MKNTIFVLLIITFCEYSYSQTNPKREVVVMRTFEAHYTVNLPNYIVISYPDNSVKEIELLSLNKKMEASPENTKIISSKIREFIQQGYKIESMSGGGDVSGIVYTYILSKD